MADKPPKLTPEAEATFATLEAANASLPGGHRYTAEIQMVKGMLLSPQAVTRALGANALTRLRSKLEH
ncbi:hypothetical protein H4CHR_02919 [Variovorax sp. PBS-H4]|uniref:hypothetical protein n=1 Tax=Variovorax sp. PBS-H4 TaxID=434008 RepID=UPI00131896C0|nr:hypothetical protein [Variovorax sp. PBS-H4]VTU31989.1 hypothetical protein H4CHR_02919 [Variovorax sp. PBS-H4]